MGNGLTDSAASIAGNRRSVTVSRSPGDAVQLDIHEYMLCLDGVDVEFNEG